MAKNLLILILICAVWSCGDDKIDTARAKAEMEAREIKKVSEAEIVSEALRLGRELTGSFTLNYTEESNLIIDTGSDTTFIKTHYVLNEENSLEGKALGIFKAYEYNLKNGITSEDIVQKLEDQNTFLYTAPSFIGDKNIGVWAIEFSRRDLVLNIKK